jgi:hypothetical protein
LLVIKTTLEFGGIIPLEGTGKRVPPPVIVALTVDMNVGLEQVRLVVLRFGHVAEAPETLIALDPVWKKTNSFNPSLAPSIHASTKIL